MSHVVLAIEPPPILRQLDVRAYGTGVGRDLASVQQRAQTLSDIYRESLAITYRETVLAEEFRMLAEQWRNETRFESSLTEITEHPAYQAIIELGDEVVHILLDELRRRREPELWFAALREITGVDPIRPDHWGNVRAMADDWLRWGGERDFIR